MKKFKNVIYLLIAATIWGIAFVAQDVGLEYIEPFTFTTVRFLLATVTLGVIIGVRALINAKKGAPRLTKEEKKVNRRTLLIGGVICGCVLCVATNLQQIGLVYTTAGKSGFITACYIVLVPILGLFFKKKCPFTVWIGVVCALVGLYFLCMSDGLGGVNKGDLITLACTVAFSAHILVIDKYSVKTDGIMLACVQCAVCTAISAVLMFVFETPNLNAMLTAWLPIVYTGVLSAGLAYLFQIYGQKDFNPTVASLLMSMESVISVIAAWLILDQKLSTSEIIGCVIIFCAVILAQIPIRKRAKTNKI